MAVDLLDHVPALKREVNPPGTNVITMTDPEWIGYLSDAFWEARLDGFLQGYDLTANPVDVDTAVIPVGTEEISRQNMALVVLYAGVRILRNRILNMPTNFRAKAGPVEFEQANSATVLAEMLKQLKSVKDRILEEQLYGGMTAVTILDAFSTRLYDPVSYGGGLELMG